MPEPEVECKKCGSICAVDGDFPKYFVWCEECSDYCSGFDCMEYGAEVMADIVDGRPSEEVSNVVPNTPS